MRILLLVVALTGLIGSFTPARAEPAPAEGHGEAVHAAAENAAQTPVLPAESTMPGILIILVLGLFLAAAVIGPIVRANLPEEIPVTHSHDEPPGTSHHHGASGTH